MLPAARRTCITVSLIAAAMAGHGGCGGSDSGAPAGSLQSRQRDALSIAHPGSRARQLIEVAEQQWQAGDIPGAESSLQAAEDSARQISDAADRAQTLNLTVLALAKMDFTRAAKDLLRDVEQVVEQIEDPESGSAALAQMALTSGRYLDNEYAAASYLALAGEMAAAAEAADSRARSLIRMAYVRHRLGDQAEAAATAQRAIEEAEQAEQPRPRADALTYIASRLRQMGCDDEAQAALDKATSAARSVEDALSRGYALSRVAAELHAVGRPAEAGKALDEAEDAANQSPDRSLKEPLLQEIYAQRRQR